MALQLCTSTDVADWWSVEGVDARLEDDLSGSVESDESLQLTRLIERASAIVAAKLSQRYLQASYAGTNPPTNTPPLVMHFAAVIAAYYLGCRRNLPHSEALLKEYERVLEMMNEIGSGLLSIPEVAESFDTTPFLTNFHLDGRYRSSKFRKVDATSVGGRPAPPIKSFPESTSGAGFFE